MVSLPTSCIDCAVKGPSCFCSLGSSSLAHLDHLGTRITIPARQPVLQEGFLPQFVYVLCEGTVKLTTSSREGRLLILRIATPGDVLGLAAALKPSPYEATAETLEPCVLKAIPASGFLAFMDDFRDVSRNGTRAVAREYDAAFLSARRLALSTSAAGKLASVLLEWARSSAHQTPDAPLGVHMTLTHEELGHMAGISRETATRLLTRFRSEGLIELRGTRLLIAHPEKLERLFC